jgi:alkylation response protein AidB-like acyl-CoA dehydrogenase
LAGHDTRELFHDDVWVPDEHLVGDPEMGLGQFQRTLEMGPICVAAPSLSLTQAVLDLATDYARERVQFGQPISIGEGTNEIQHLVIARELGC